ncbi:hypothetical protein [Okeania sp. KiyG1]|uniref:hypothetical protein n=1 Tax=Okeania sp. KiyG1 TaxID=2720165 RepID=UPI0019221C89|nr:hypothetical protein [Okeania sp. KiyG1]GGA32968.1 hypothetical protein CYANOKiyG1_49940 [Okeania sp. KiyG1]
MGTEVNLDKIIIDRNSNSKLSGISIISIERIVKLQKNQETSWVNYPLINLDIFSPSSNTALLLTKLDRSSCANLTYFQEYYRGKSFSI